jgi:hypothetical protein
VPVQELDWVPASEPELVLLLVPVSVLLPVLV